jgi:TolB-like protein
MELRFATLILIPVWAMAVQGAASLESPMPTASLFLPAVGVRLVPVHPSGCMEASDVKSVSDRLGHAATASGVFSLSPDASYLLRLRAESSDGICQLVAEFQGDDVRLEGRRILGPGETIRNSKRLEQAVEEVASNWSKLKAATLNVGTRPAGAQVRVRGVSVGNAPLAATRLNPGAAVVQISLPGWEGVADTVFLEAGNALRRDYVLHHSSGERRDSLWAFARSTPGQALPDLFSRLIPKDLPATRQSVAILPFQVEGNKPASAYDPGVMAAEYGVAQYSKDPRFAVVEREGLNRLVQEQALGQTGALDDSGAVRAGKLLAVKYLVTGTVRVDGARQEFAARMVSVETGEIVSAAVANCASQKTEDLYRTALGERGQVSAAMYRSAAGPGWGQFYTGHPVQGSLALGATVAAVGWAGWSWFDYSDKNRTLDKFRNGDPSTVFAGESVDQWVAAAENARKRRNDASVRFGWSLGIVGAVWMANLVDAGILGGMESSRIRTQYFTWVPSADLAPDGLRLSWRF